MALKDLKRTKPIFTFHIQSVAANVQNNCIFSLPTYFRVSQLYTVLAQLSALTVRGHILDDHHQSSLT